MDPSTLGTMIVGDLLARWPAVVRVFNGHGMACPGCAMAPFMTVNEACDAYGVDRGQLVEALLRELADEPAP